jgi:hypothetical protein
MESAADFIARRSAAWTDDPKKVRVKDNRPEGIPDLDS